MVLQGKLDEIKKIYKTVFHNNQNLTSTILLHCPLYNVYSSPAPYRVNVKYRSGIDSSSDYTITKTLYPITLLTGDALINKELGKRIIKSCDIISDKIGILQLPHHGAHRNYQFMKKQNIESEVYIASYGLGNTYKHPSRETIDDLYAKGKKFYSANQYEFFDYWID